MILHKCESCLMLQIAKSLKKKIKIKNTRTRRMHFPLIERTRSRLLSIEWRFALSNTRLHELVNGIVWHTVIGCTSSARNIVSTLMAACTATFCNARIYVCYWQLCISFAATNDSAPANAPLEIMRPVRHGVLHLCDRVPSAETWLNCPIGSVVSKITRIHIISRR